MTRAGDADEAEVLVCHMQAFGEHSTVQVAKGATM